MEPGFWPEKSDICHVFNHERHEQKIYNGVLLFIGSLSEDTEVYTEFHGEKNTEETTS
jgi:hypothetical protein